MWFISSHKYSTHNLWLYITGCILFKVKEQTNSHSQQKTPQGSHTVGLLKVVSGYSPVVGLPSPFAFLGVRHFTRWVLAISVISSSTSLLWRR